MVALVRTYQDQHIDPADTAGCRRADEFVAAVQAEAARIRATGGTWRPAKGGVSVHQRIDVVEAGSTVIGYQG